MPEHNYSTKHLELFFQGKVEEMVDGEPCILDIAWHSDNTLVPAQHPNADQFDVGREYTLLQMIRRDLDENMKRIYILFREGNIDGAIAIIRGFNEWAQRFQYDGILYDQYVEYINNIRVERLSKLDSDGHLKNLDNLIANLTYFLTIRWEEDIRDLLTSMNEHMLMYAVNNFNILAFEKLLAIEQISQQFYKDPMRYIEFAIEDKIDDFLSFPFTFTKMNLDVEDWSRLLCVFVHRYDTEKFALLLMNANLSETPDAASINALISKIVLISISRPRTAAEVAATNIMIKLLLDTVVQQFPDIVPSLDASFVDAIRLRKDLHNVIEENPYKSLIQNLTDEQFDLVMRVPNVSGILDFFLQSHPNYLLELVNGEMPRIVYLILNNEIFLSPNGIYRDSLLHLLQRHEVQQFLVDNENWGKVIIQSVNEQYDRLSNPRANITSSDLDQLYSIPALLVQAAKLVHNRTELTSSDYGNDERRETLVRKSILMYEYFKRDKDLKQVIYNFYERIFGVGPDMHSPPVNEIVQELLQYLQETNILEDRDNPIMVNEYLNFLLMMIANKNTPEYDKALYEILKRILPIAISKPLINLFALAFDELNFVKMLAQMSTESEASRSLLHTSLAAMLPEPAFAEHIQESLLRVAINNPRAIADVATILEIIVQDTQVYPPIDIKYVAEQAGNDNTLDALLTLSTPDMTLIDLIGLIEDLQALLKNVAFKDPKLATMKLPGTNTTISIADVLQLIGKLTQHLAITIPIPETLPENQNPIITWQDQSKWLEAIPARAETNEYIQALIKISKWLSSVESDIGTGPLAKAIRHPTRDWNERQMECKSKTDTIPVPAEEAPSKAAGSQSGFLPHAELHSKQSSTKLAVLSNPSEEADGENLSEYEKFLQEKKRGLKPTGRNPSGKV